MTPWLERWLRIGFSKRWLFSWNGYDVQDERCAREGCGVKRRNHVFIEHSFEDKA